MEKNLSFLDLKIVFGRVDQALSKTRLIDEI